MQKFLQNAGVNFDGVPGSSLAFDGEQLIVTQTPRNIDRLRTILRNYTEVKQVEIETKFLEVSQNDLDELGFHWGLGSNFAGEDWTIASNLRSLSDIGGSDSSNRARIISGESAPGVSNTEESFKDDPVKINPPDVEALYPLALHFLSFQIRQQETVLVALLLPDLLRIT